MGASLNMFDVAPYADGAAAIVSPVPVCCQGRSQTCGAGRGSSLITGSLALHDRNDLLAFPLPNSGGARLPSAGIMPRDVDFFELFDAFAVYALLSLEAAGFARHGEGWKLGQEGKLALDGEMPLSR